MTKRISSTKRQTGIDALEFVKQSKGGWDTIVWDPPYMDPHNKDHQERINKRRRNWYDRNNRFKKTNYTRFMERDTRKKILAAAIAKAADKYTIIQFHTILDELWIQDRICTHVWVKHPIQPISGSRDPFNGEYINIVGTKKFNGHLDRMNEYIVVDVTTAYKGIMIKRGCAKPLELFKKIFKHVRATHILDPFAGLGNSIVAADRMEIPIDACDLDSSLKWDGPSLEDWLL